MLSNLIPYGGKYKIYLSASLGALAVFILFFWFQDIASGETGRVRKFILKGKKAIEARNIFTCADIISMGYEDKYGNDRSSLIYAVKEGFSYYSKIRISIEEMKINLDETKEHAQVEITALAIGQPKDRVAEKILEGEKGRFKVKLAKEDKKWKLLEIEFYEPVTIMGHEIGEAGLI